MFNIGLHRLEKVVKNLEKPFLDRDGMIIGEGDKVKIQITDKTTGYTAWVPTTVHYNDKAANGHELAIRVNFGKARTADGWRAVEGIVEAHPGLNDDIEVIKQKTWDYPWESRVVAGNILDAKERYVAFVTSCNGGWYEGLEADIKYHYYDAYVAHQAACRKGEEYLLGTCQRSVAGNKQLCGLYAQKSCTEGENQVHYNELDKALRQLAPMVGSATVAFPFNMGGDWEVINFLVEKNFPEGNYVFYRPVENVINNFRGEYNFLSNMYSSKIKLGSRTFKCAEAAFQAAKCANKADIAKFEELTGAEARKLGREVELRSDWAEKKLKVMRMVVTAKFDQDLQLQYLLKQTGTHPIVEGNTWGDTFWGVCHGKGENHLGKILMDLRSKL